MHIAGDFNSHAARLMNIQLIKCHGEDYCESPEKITEFLRNKYFVFMYNLVKFQADGFGEDSVKEEARLIWLSINT